MARGRWSVRVPLWFWAVGTGIWAFAALLLLTLADAWNPDAGNLAVLALLCGLSGWGLARWFATPPDPPRQVNALISLIVWCVATPFVVRGLAALLPTAHGFGTYERFLLVPAIVALVLVIARRLRLNLLISRYVALVLVVAFVVRGDAGDPDPARVSIAAAPELARAAETGAAQFLARGRGPVPRVERQRCRDVSLDDRRATLVGAAGRRIQVSVRGCWDAAGRPSSLVVRQRADNGGERGDLRTVAPSTELLQGLATASPLVDADAGLSSGAGDGESLFAASEGVIAVALAWESADLLLGRRRDRGPLAQPSISRGVALDVVLATLRLEGESAAELTRFASSGRRVLARSTTPASP